MENDLKSLNIYDSHIESQLIVVARIIEDVTATAPEISKRFWKILRKYLREKIRVEFEESWEAESVDVGVQTETEESGDSKDIIPWDCSNIANEVASVAEKNLEENGFVYDTNSGMYYDHKQQCYYDPNRKLYYYHQTSSYYYYDEESKSLKYYCSAQTEEKVEDCKNNGQIQEERPVVRTGMEKDDTLIGHSASGDVMEVSMSRVGEDIVTVDLPQEKEEGECSDSECESEGPDTLAQSLPVISETPCVIEAGPTAFVPDHSNHRAPCIRVLVTASSLSKLTVGTLFIITCTGGTLGREGDCDILIPDVLVSKIHSSFQYVYKDGLYSYEIVDKGSRNGTFVNGKRLSDTLVESIPFEITHGSNISVGGTTLLCHIHPNDETCQGCEPFSVNPDEKNPEPANKMSLKEQHRRQMSMIRKKFGVEHSIDAKYPSGYEDRAQGRRKKVGSSHPSEKTEQASIETPIDKRNKGYRLISKMGWKEGGSLGKDENGIAEPITVKKQPVDKAGLGSTPIFP